MEGQDRLRYRSVMPVPVGVPIERISRANRSQRAADSVTNQIVMLAGRERHAFLADLEQWITPPVAVFIRHWQTVLADLFNLHANAVVPLIFAGKSRVPAILRINGHCASEAAPVVRRRAGYD